MKNGHLETFDYLRLVEGDSDQATLGLDSRWVIDIRPLAGFRRTEGEDGAYGRIDWQRQEIAVHRLDTLLGKPESRLSRDQRILIINSQPTWGLMVETVMPVARGPSRGVTSAPNSFIIEQESIIEGLFTDEHGIVTLLEPTGLQRALFGRTATPSWPTPGVDAQWRGKPMVERVGAQVRASMNRRSGLQLVIFKSANHLHQRHLFAFSLSQVMEVVTPGNIQKSSIELNNLLGVSMWHDWPIPILDWENIIGLGRSTHADGDSKRLLICISARGDVAGLLIGPEVETIRLPRVAHSIENPGLWADRIAGTYAHQSENMVLLDINRLILPATPIN